MLFFGVVADGVVKSGEFLESSHFPESQHRAFSLPEGEM